MIRRLAMAVLLAVASVPAGAVGGACGVASAAGNRAGVVIAFPDGESKEFCVAFDEAEISGLELLRRTGLAVTVQDFGAGNLTVCSIDGEGCPYPERPCFCACADTGNCTFWGYYRLQGGAWRFAQAGAGSAVVRNGDVDGWRLARQTPSGGAAPGTSSLATVCARGVKVAAARPSAPADDGGVGGVVWVAAAVVLLAALGVWGARSRRRGSEAP